MSNKMRNLFSSVTFEQEIELLSMPISIGCVHSIVHAINNHKLSFNKLKDVLKIHNILINNYPSDAFRFDLTTLFDALVFYDLPTITIKTLLDKQYSYGSIKKICLLLGENILTLNDINLLLKYDLNLHNKYCGISVDDKFETICSILEYYSSLEDVLNTFKPEFNSCEMLLSLIKFKLNKNENPKITPEQINKLITILEPKTRLDAFYNESHLENVISAIDDEYPFEIILLIGKTGNFLGENILEYYKNKKLSYDIIEAILNSEIIYDTENFVAELLENTNLTNKQILNLCTKKLSSDSMDKFVNYFSSKH